MFQAKKQSTPSSPSRSILSQLKTPTTPPKSPSRTLVNSSPKTTKIAPAGPIMSPHKVKPSEKKVPTKQVIEKFYFPDGKTMTDDIKTKEEVFIWLMIEYD